MPIYEFHLQNHLADRHSDQLKQSNICGGNHRSLVRAALRIDELLIVAKSVFELVIGIPSISPIIHTFYIVNIEFTNKKMKVCGLFIFFTSIATNAMNADNT